MNKSDFEKEISKYEVDLEAQAVVTKWLQEHKYSFILGEEGHHFRIKIEEDGPYVMLILPPKNTPVRPIWLLALPNFWPVPLSNITLAQGACCYISAHAVLAKVYPVYDEEDEIYRMYAAVETFAASPEEFMECFLDCLEILQNANQAFFIEYANRALAAGQPMQSVLMGMEPDAIRHLMERLCEDSEHPELKQLLDMLN